MFWKEEELQSNVGKYKGKYRLHSLPSLKYKETNPLECGEDVLP